jgi:regulator of nucleoside diphosphate kinase
MWWAPAACSAPNVGKGSGKIAGTPGGAFVGGSVGRSLERAAGPGARWRAPEALISRRAVTHAASRRRSRAAALLLEDVMNRKMMLGDPPAIRLTRTDLGRLDTLLAAYSSTSRVLDYLRREIDRASVVPDDDPPEFVRLGSHVAFEDEAGKPYAGTLAYPSELARHPDGISILTPVGAALIGLAEGQSISYETLDGRIKTLTIRRILP